MIERHDIGKRHTSIESFDRFLGSRVPVLLPIRGEPAAFVFIEPVVPELGLRITVEAGTTAPDTGLRHISARTSSRNGLTVLEVVVTAPALFRDAYPVLCSMADRVQIDGLSPSAALRATLDRMSTLLLAPESMSREREIGLFGELLFLNDLGRTSGIATAVTAWRGGLAEEHDFGLPTADVEVKSTSGERRVHWIESLTQLVPTGERPLWLVSHQLTAAGAGDGQTLPESIDRVRELIRDDRVRTRYEEALVGCGWREDERPRFTTRWTRRTRSRAFPVQEGFPRLVPDALRASGVLLDRIPDIRYRVDLEGLDLLDELPPEISKLVGVEGWT